MPTACEMRRNSRLSAGRHMSAILYMSVYGYVRGEVCVLVEEGRGEVDQTLVCALLGRKSAEPR